MNENFNKIKEILKAEINKINKQIKDNEKRYQLILANQFEIKAMATIIFSILPCFFFTFLVESLIMSGAFPLFFGTNANYFSLTIASSALLTGNVVRKIIEWKTNTMSKFKKISRAKTETQKIEDEIKYAIEIEKAKNRKEALFQTAKLIKNNSLNKIETQKNIDNLSTKLTKEYYKLDILTTQKVLSKKCWKIRTKGMLICDFMLFSLCGSFLTFLYCALPLIISSKNIVFSSISLFPTVAPLVIGFLGGWGYLIKRNKDYEKAFNNINQQLGEYSLPNKIKESNIEQKEINSKIAKEKETISFISNQLLEQKIIIANNYEKSTPIVNSTLEKENLMNQDLYFNEQHNIKGRSRVLKKF